MGYYENLPFVRKLYAGEKTVRSLRDCHPTKGLAPQTLANQLVYFASQQIRVDRNTPRHILVSGFITTLSQFLYNNLSSICPPTLCSRLPCRYKSAGVYTMNDCKHRPNETREDLGSRITRVKTGCRTCKYVSPAWITKYLADFLLGYEGSSVTNHGRPVADVCSLVGTVMGTAFGEVGGMRMAIGFKAKHNTTPF